MKCFYHSADLDGHCSGAIVKLFNPECELLAINYGQDFPWDKIGPGEKIFMVDFSLQPFDGMVKLYTIADLIWIDHHQSAIDDYMVSCITINGIQTSGIGACALTWQYFNMPDPLKMAKGLPYSINLLAKYDVWDFTDENALPFQYGMRLQNTDPRTEKGMNLWKLLFAKEDIIDSIINAGKTILEYESQTNTKFCKAYSFETVMPVYPLDKAANGIPPTINAICVNKGFTNSKVFDSIWNPEKHDIMITFCRLPLPKKQWTVSLYSDKPNIDCGYIAKSFGGGGHKGAAGFQCDNLPFEY